MEPAHSPDPAAKLPPRPAVPLRFDSRSEYACGVLLERHVRGFELKMGETLQVPVGFGKLIDFKIHGVYVEYHPTNLHHEFDNRAALRKLIDATKRLKEHQRLQILDAVRDELHEKYCRRRLFLLHATVSKDAELIVARSPDDFYHTVLKRFAVDYPSLKDFRKDFHRLVDGKI